MSDRGRERDLVLAPNEFAFILDETKGNINVYVGPHKTSLANTDVPVIFDSRTKRFDRKTLDLALQMISIAPEGWYLVLKNPATDKSHPRTGALNNLPNLDTGRKVNIPGPISFALWPGQMMRVLQGHHLRSNQYLLVRVYDEEAAMANWKNAVIKPQKTGEGEAEGGLLYEDKPDLTMGNLLVIRGTQVSFYIPPTGVEVVPDVDANYVREAVTLERLEYCILLDENGSKRFIVGPDVVFPKPTEVIVRMRGARKFRAIELNENSGLYLKVIAPYEENGVSYKVGDELFLTGRDQMIYFPRTEHAIVKYGEQEKHHAVAIPAGEARYVLDRLTGKISLRRGPAMFLPDPRREVIVRRVLDPRTVSLWFPNNREAFEYNRKLAAQSSPALAAEGLAGAGSPATPAPAQRQAAPAKAASGAIAARETQMAPQPPNEFAGDDFNRNQNFTSPRTIVLDTRFEGAVAIDVWTGYAVLVVSKTGERQVVSGPHTRLLEYDENLQVLELSTGKPKSDENLLKTVYLRTLNNKVTDEVEAETLDLVRVHLQLSYRVNFEGDAARWFEVENYVKFLTDHLRSLIRHAVKRHGIEHFYANSVAILRDIILGVVGEDGKRPGRRFDENGMRIYDVEVLEVSIGDDTIASLLVKAQHAAVQQTLQLAAEQRRLEATRQTESIGQQIAELQSETRQKSSGLKTKEIEQQLRHQLAEQAAKIELHERQQTALMSEQERIAAIHDAELRRRGAVQEQELGLAQQKLDQRLKELQGEVSAVVDKARAVSPDLIAALQAFGDRALAEKMAESMAPLAILGGESVSEVLGRLLRGTPLARLLAPDTKAIEASKP